LERVNGRQPSAAMPPSELHRGDSQASSALLALPLGTDVGLPPV